MQFIKRIYKTFHKNSYDYFVLGGDVGGTNINLGIFGVKINLPNLLLSFNFSSKDLKALHYAVNEVLSYIKTNYKIKIIKACFGVAGVLSSRKDFAEITNIKWNLSVKELLKKTELKKVILINDFEAIGYGINILSKKDIFVIKKAKKIPKAPILIIGAGTGLGKTILLYSEYQKSYAPIPSEAGHSDFAVQNQNEFDLIIFIKKYKKIKSNISYEQVLSGRGLSNIYLFLRKSKKFKETKCTEEIDKSNNQPELISKYKKIDKTCKTTFEIFKAIYAKFARNFALDCLPFGGVYIAGGIAPKNREIFDKDFVEVFERNYKMKNVLKKIPVYLILNYNVGLLGAGFVGAKFLT